MEVFWHYWMEMYRNIIGWRCIGILLDGDVPEYYWMEMYRNIIGWGRFIGTVLNRGGLRGYVLVDADLFHLGDQYLEQPHDGLQRELAPPGEHLEGGDEGRRSHPHHNAVTL